MSTIDPRASVLAALQARLSPLRGPARRGAAGTAPPGPGPRSWMLEKGLVTQESDQWQYRFDAIVDPESMDELFRLEHEVRSLTHPMFTRQWSLVNRNPEQVQEAYRVGRDMYYAS